MQPPPPPQEPDWEEIDTVLLDMDGTLLDRHFDDHFWEEFVPGHYAARHQLTPDESRARLRERYRAEEGTLNWYDVDYWSSELGLDIMALKTQVEHLVAIHPGVVDFLERVRRPGRRIFLVTNAHGRTLRFKMERTALAGRFDALVTAHDIGVPKETPLFWDRLRSQIGFDPARTLLAEDTVRILETAESYGIRWLVHIARPSSSLPPSFSERYRSIESFAEILPDLA